MRPETSQSDLSHFFEYSGFGLQVLEDGLLQLSFGEFLVSQNAITRQELLCGLQLQDQNPGVKLGECLAKLGAIAYPDVEKHLARWNQVHTVEA